MKLFSGPRCSHCGKPITEAVVAHKTRLKHVMGGYFCYATGPEYAKLYLIEEQP